MNPAEESQRHAFEAWISAPPFERDVARNSMDEQVSAWPGHYTDYPVQLAWEAWIEVALPLANWKAEAMTVYGQCDFQAVAKLLGVTLGHAIMPEIEPRIRALITDLDRGRQVMAAALEKMDRYINRQGATRMLGKSYGEGSASNPHRGEHYPQVQSVMDRMRHHIGRPTETPPRVVSFDNLPLGSRFRYIGNSDVYVVLEKRRLHSDSGPMEGTIAKWRPDLIGESDATQGIFHFDPTETPHGVVAID